MNVTVTELYSTWTLQLQNFTTLIRKSLHKYFTTDERYCYKALWQNFEFARKTINQ